MVTVGESISRVRNVIKAVKEDAFVTDRFLYSLIIKYATVLVRRQDNENKILRIQNLFQTIPCIDLIPVSKIEACCGGIKTNCTIMRTKDPIPDPMEGSAGPLLRSVTSIDGSVLLVNTNPVTYTSMANQSTFKYNTSKYYWYLDKHLYFPNIEWESIRLDGIFTGSIQAFTCENPCLPRQDDTLHVPDFLFAEIEQMVIKDLGFMIQTPVEGQDDNRSPLR